MSSNPGLELVSLTVRNENTQKFAVLDVAHNTRRVLPLRDLDGTQNWSFVRYKEDQFFVAGGTQHGHPSNAVYSLNIATERLEKLPAFPAKVSQLKLFPFDGKIYCFGGVTETMTPSPTYAYDVLKQTYEPLQFIPYTYKDILAVFGYKDLIVLALNDSRFVCFEPETGEWSFWKQIGYKFDFVFAFENKLFLADSIAKSILCYNIEDDLVVVQSMFDAKANELLFCPRSDRLFILQHAEEPVYYLEVNLRSFEFRKSTEGQYKDLFADGILFRNSPVFQVYPIHGGRKASDGRPEKVVPVDNPDLLRLFGSFEVPFEIEANLATSAFVVNSVSTKLTLKDSQVMVKLDADTYLFAGGKKSEYNLLGDTAVQKYSLLNKRAQDLRELPVATESLALGRVRDELFFLSELTDFFSYSLTTNQWFRLAPKSQAPLLNHFVYKDRLFIFSTREAPGKPATFVTEEWVAATRSWATHSIPEVDFRVQAEFSFKVSENTFLFIGSELKQAPLQRTPVLYEVTVAEVGGPVGLKGPIQVRVTKVTPLADYVVKMSEIRPFVHGKQLLFLLLDAKGKIHKVIYDTEKRTLVDDAPLNWFFDTLTRFFETIQMDSDHLRNFKVAN